MQFINYTLLQISKILEELEKEFTKEDVLFHLTIYSNFKYNPIIEFEFNEIEVGFLDIYTGIITKPNWLPETVSDDFFQKIEQTWENIKNSHGI